MKYFGWVFLFFIVVYILPLASRPLLSPDEFRYAEIPREMILSGDYTTPRLLGMRYFEKPPLGYWMTAGSIQLFGENAFAVRFPMAAAAGLASLFIWLLVQPVTRDEKLAALAATVYLCFSAVYLLGTTAVLDSILSMFVVGSCGCAFLALLEPKFNRRKLLMLMLTGVFVGAAFLTKGFIAFAIPALTIAGFLIWQKRWKEFLIMPLPILICAAAVILPWALAIYRAEPDFWRYFIVVEHLQRFSDAGAGQHAAPWYFYLPVLVVGALPAALLVPAACFVGKDAWPGMIRQPLYRYSLCFLVLPLIFFSCADGKLPTYILPCFAPAAILIAAGVRTYFNCGGHHRSYNWTMTAWGILLIAAGALLILTRIFYSRIPVQILAEIPLTPLFYPVMGSAALLAGIMMLYSQTGNWRGRLYLFFFGIALILLCMNWFLTGSLKMPEHFFLAARKHFHFEPEFTMICTSPRHMHAAAWSLRKPEIRIFSSGELEYGCAAALKEGKPSVELPLKKLIAHIKDPKRLEAVAVMFDSRYTEWKLLPPSPLPAFECDELTARFYPAPAAVDGTVIR